MNPFGKKKNEVLENIGNTAKKWSSEKPSLASLTKWMNDPGFKSNLGHLNVECHYSMSITKSVNQ